MKISKKLKYMLDGNSSEQAKIVKDFLESLTDEEKEESMSDKFSYLDEDLD